MGQEEARTEEEAEKEEEREEGEEGKEEETVEEGGKEEEEDVKARSHIGRKWRRRTFTPSPGNWTKFVPMTPSGNYSKRCDWLWNGNKDLSLDATCSSLFLLGLRVDI